MTLTEIIYNIKNLRAGGLQSDDEDLSDAQYAFIIGYYRAKLLKQDSDKGRTLRSQDIQDLGLVDVIKSSDDCCDTEECTLRTSLQLPKFLEFNDISLITFVGTQDGQSFQQTTSNGAQWNKYSKYTSKQTRWFVNNNYIYISNPPTDLLSYINVKGAFEDPKAANIFRTCDCEGNEASCYIGNNFSYPLSLDRVDLIVKMIAETEFRILQTIIQDDINDGQSQNIRKN